MKRIAFGVAGLLSAALGFIGIFVPVLPTTPLLLLAAFCLSRSSRRLSEWLEGTRAYQLYVRPFKESGGIPLKRKMYILAVSFGVMALSAILVQKPLVWGILAAVAIFLLWLMLVHIPTIDEYVTTDDADQQGTTGVLLMNTGTPDAPQVEAIARYLDEFLMDPAIIGAPWPIRRMIVNKIISDRPRKTLQKYQSFWTQEGSPYMLACLKQGEMLQERLASLGMPVAVAMRYGNPSIEHALGRLRDEGCTRLVVLPCYPQYTKVCAGTCLKAVKKAAKKTRWTVRISEVRDFYGQPAFRRALAESVRASWTPESGSRLVISCHSTLLKDIRNGDPYRDQVEATAANLAADLGVDADMVTVSYQSRFDNRKWLEPSTESAIVRLAREGISVAVLCPCFVADNLETFHDVNVELRETYLQNAPKDCTFTYIPCLNVDPGLIEALAEAVCDGRPDSI